MFPFWETVIAPVLAAAGARTVVEVGALRGDTTTRLLEDLGPDATLHVVDPAPGFDPAEHEEAFPGRYVFHRRPSVDVLAELGPVDAALVDGDHNWYTVTRELALLDAAARGAGRPLPVLVLHDVGWPYGRRDLYYDPDSVPEEHRQPHRRAGLRPGRAELCPPGQGMSQGHWNAEREGGPRNGVMTALEDFLSSSPRQLRLVVLPLYFGLAIVADEERLTARPELAAVLDRLEGAEGRRALIELGEQIRVRAAAHHHTVVRAARDRHEALARRYLDGVVRELGAAPGGRLHGVRGALDDVRRRGVEGDVVVVTGDDPAPALLARAHAEAVGDDRRTWVAVAPGVDADAVRAEVRAGLARLDLPDDLEVGPVDRAGPARPPAGAPVALVVGAGAGPGVEAAVAALAPHLAPGARVVDVRPGPPSAPGPGAPRG